MNFRMSLPLAPSQEEPNRGQTKNLHVCYFGSISEIIACCLNNLDSNVNSVEWWKFLLTYVKENFMKL